MTSRLLLCSSENGYSEVTRTGFTTDAHGDVERLAFPKMAAMILLEFRMGHQGMLTAIAKQWRQDLGEEARLQERAMVIGVMGPGESASSQNLAIAHALGAFIAQKGWILLSGGRDVGVMQACNRAARQQGGLTVALLPSVDRTTASPDVILPLPTGLGHARNVLNIHASDVVVVCGYGFGAGTLSELAIALKTHKPVILISDRSSLQPLLEELDAPGLHSVETLAQATALLDSLVQDILSQAGAELLFTACFPKVAKVANP